MGNFQNNTYDDHRIIVQNWREEKKKLRPQTKIVSAAKCWSVQFSEEMNCTKPKKR